MRQEHDKYPSIAIVDCTLRVANTDLKIARMLEHQPSAANYDQSRVHVARRTSASHYWRKEILPHRRPVTFPFWIKDAREEERLQTFG